MFFVEFVETKICVSVTDSGIKKIAKIPDGAVQNNWSCGINGVLDNARTGNWELFQNPAEILYILGTVLQNNDE